ncbi:MAG: hypothetical protein EB127_29585 [Alphaproteobacteria bacterium]|nr:hypothetical protein [Alphaproteobacteria bacterium]
MFFQPLEDITMKQEIKMSIVEMAKAHLQNVHAKIEELKGQKQFIEEEIQKLSIYITKGLEQIENSEKVSTEESK